MNKKKNSEIKKEFDELDEEVIKKAQILYSQYCTWRKKFSKKQTIAIICEVYNCIKLEVE